MSEQRAKRPAGHDDRAFGDNGPPVPIEMAEDSGFSKATFGTSGFGQSKLPPSPPESHARESSRSQNEP